jgi:hypothetical protein
MKIKCVRTTGIIGAVVMTSGLSQDGNVDWFGLMLDFEIQKGANQLLIVSALQCGSRRDSYYLRPGHHSLFTHVGEQLIRIEV